MKLAWACMKMNHRFAGIIPPSDQLYHLYPSFLEDSQRHRSSLAITHNGVTIVITTWKGQKLFHPILPLFCECQAGTGSFLRLYVSHQVSCCKYILNRGSHFHCHSSTTISCFWIMNYEFTRSNTWSVCKILGNYLNMIVLGELTTHKPLDERTIFYLTLTSIKILS